MIKKNIAVLIDLELSKKSGGHVKFWERICESIKQYPLDIKLNLFFLGKKEEKIRFSKSINFNILKPIFSTKFLRFFGIDADYTDLFPINLRLFFQLRRFDLIHTTDQLFTMSRTARLASKIWKIPLTTSYHTDATSYTKYYVLKIFSKLPFLLKYIIIDKIKLHEIIAKNQKKKIINYFLSVKQIMIDDKILNDYFCLKNKKSIHLQRGINKNIFKKKKINKEKTLEKFSLPKKKIIIFFCGRIHRLKGVFFLAEIHKELENKGVDVVTVLAGEDFEGDECKKIGGDNLIVINYLNQNEISSFMNICDFFVFPSLYETGPQVVLEAKACEAVCIVSPDGGGKRIKHNIDGIIMEKYSSKVWCNEIIKLLDNSKKTNTIKKNLKKSKNQATWKDIFFKCFYNSWKKIL